MPLQSLKEEADYDMAIVTAVKGFKVYATVVIEIRSQLRYDNIYRLKKFIMLSEAIFQ